MSDTKELIDKLNRSIAILNAPTEQGDPNYCSPCISDAALLSAALLSMCKECLAKIEELKAELAEIHNLHPDDMTLEEFIEVLKDDNAELSKYAQEKMSENEKLKAELAKAKERKGNE
jgi:predicted RNase H-like nuclease (RuvC/YqgF family)